MADETAAIGDNSLQQIPGAGRSIFLVVELVPVVTCTMGRAPLMAQKSDSNMKHLKAVETPLITDYIWFRF
jgi:hypothetical protein